MNYTVQNRTTGEVVYAYNADVAVDWPEYPFAEFNHIPQPPVIAPTPQRRVTKLEFVGRLGADYIQLLVLSNTNVGIEAFIKMIDWATPDPNGTSLDLNDPRLVGALNQLEQSGDLAAGRAAEILA